MEYYVGLDVSLKHTSICVVNPTGSIVQEGVVDSDPEAIALFVRSRAPGTVRIGIETGPTTTWLWTELNRLGLPVICIDARHAKAVLKMQINKSDRNDAAGIARIMQTGWFKEVRVKDLDSHAVKALLATGVDGQDQARSREPDPWPSQELRSGHRPWQVQRLCCASRGVDRQSSRADCCSEAVA